MQFMIEVDDKLAQAFFQITPAHEQKSALTAMLTQYVKEKSHQNQENIELDFVGMWADDSISVDKQIQQWRQGRTF